MPRPGPRRPQVILRMGEDGLAAVDQIAEEEGLNRSEAIRTLLKEAISARIAKGWRPRR